MTGHHLLDTTIDEASAQLGGCYFLTLRQAVRKMPGALLNAICKREEQAYMRANELEYVSAKMKKQIREEALEKHIQKMPPALSGIPMVLDPNEKLLFVGATSRTQIDLFIDNFFQATKLEPLQLTPGAHGWNGVPDHRGDFPRTEYRESARERRGAGDRPRFPDVALVLQRDDRQAPASAVRRIRHPDRRTADLCGRGRGEGRRRNHGQEGRLPLRSAEAKAAVAVGKKLKKAKLSLTREKQVWSGTFDADQFAFGSFKLPEGDALTNEDEIFAERVQNLIVFREAMTLYFRKFAETMMGLEFPKFENEIREWAKNRDAI